MKTLFNGIIFALIFVGVLVFLETQKKERAKELKADQDAKVAKTRATMKHALESRDNFMAFCQGGVEDEWGHPIVIQGGNGEKTAGVTLISYGPDGKPGTDDDIKVSGGVDWNKVGENVGKGVKEFGKGFIKGLKE